MKDSSGVRFYMTEKNVKRSMEYGVFQLGTVHGASFHSLFLSFLLSCFLFRGHCWKAKGLTVSLESTSLESPTSKYATVIGGLPIWCVRARASMRVRACVRVCVRACLGSPHMYAKVRSFYLRGVARAIYAGLIGDPTVKLLGSSVEGTCVPNQYTSLPAFSSRNGMPCTPPVSSKSAVSSLYTFVLTCVRAQS